MSDRRVLLTALVLCVAAGSLLAAGCGGDNDDEAGAGATTAATPGALPIEERVVQGDLAGLAPAGPPQIASTPAQFVELVNPDQPEQEAAAFREGGFVEGAVQLYMVQQQGDFGLSAASQFGSPQQAQAEADRLGDDFARDTPPGTTEGSLPGVPGSRTIVASGSASGEQFTIGSAVFADGPFVYVQLAGGSGGVDPQAVLDDAAALYERVKGSPAT